MKCLKLAILLLLIPLCCVAFAALAKTTAIVELDPWQLVVGATLDVGAAGDISDSYDTLLYLEIAYADAQTQDGVDVSIEVSYGDDNWTLLTKPFTTPLRATETSTLDGAVFNTDVNILLIDGSKFDKNGQKWFIEDSTPADSESVRTKDSTVHDISICKDLLRGHDTGTSVWDVVYEYIIPIPAGFAYVRVLINNTDADADIYYTTRISKVTSL